MRWTAMMFALGLVFSTATACEEPEEPESQQDVGDEMEEAGATTGDAMEDLGEGVGEGADEAEDEYDAEY